MAVTSKQLPDNPAVCPSGQCKFPPYTTLALCHSIEDVTSQLINQSSNATPGFSNWVTLPGIRVPTGSEYLTFWTTTLWRSDNQTRALGQSSNLTMLAPNVSETSIDELAQVLLVHNDPCLTTNNRSSMYYPDTWRAYKATIRLCLETRSTQFNTSSRTNVTETHLEPLWKYSSRQIQTANGFVNSEFWSTSLNDSPENYSISVDSQQILGEQIARSFNVSGGFIPGADNYIYGDVGSSGLVTDILGDNPTLCPNKTGYALEGFSRRVAHVTNGVTNA